MLAFWVSRLVIGQGVTGRGKSNCIPCLRQRDQRTPPCPAARPRIAQIRDCPSPPRGGGAECVCYNSLYISLQFSVKRFETTKFCVIWSMRTTATNCSYFYLELVEPWRDIA